MGETNMTQSAMTLWELITARAEASPEKQMAIDEAGRTMTFAQYQQRCEVAAAGFADSGVQAGTVVTWILPSTFESLILAGALSRLGAVQNPILPIYGHKEIGFILGQAGTSVLVIPRAVRGFDFAEMAEELTGGTDVATVVVEPDLPSGDPSRLPKYATAADDVRWLFYSSGTTADPKGAMHTDASISAASDGMQCGCHIGPDDKSAVVFPITHVGGLVWLFNSMQTGVELLMVEAFNPAEILRPNVRL